MYQVDGTDLSEVIVFQALAVSTAPICVLVKIAWGVLNSLTFRRG